MKAGFGRVKINPPIGAGDGSNPDGYLEPASRKWSGIEKRNATTQVGSRAFLYGNLQ